MEINNLDQSVEKEGEQLKRKRYPEDTKEREFEGFFKSSIIEITNKGCTSLYDKYSKELIHHDSNKPTGVTFHIKNVWWNNNLYKLEIWFIEPKGRFEFVLPNYLRLSSIVAFVINYYDQKTLYKLKELVYLIKKEYERLPILLAFNVDSKGELSLDNRDEIIEYAMKIGMNAYIEISVKSGQNIEELFKALVQLCLKKLSGHSD
ncbi:MAG: hypothetical protein ACQERB_05780 [Promethearchaeati archaeon]